MNAVGDELADRMAAIFAAAGGFSVERAHDPDEVDRLFAARRLAYPSLARLSPVLTEDIVVPRSLVPEMLARIEGSRPMRAYRSPTSPTLATATCTR